MSPISVFKTPYNSTNIKYEYGVELTQEHQVELYQRQQNRESKR